MPEDVEILYNYFCMTPLWEHPKWKLFIYKIFKWPKKWKPTGYIAPPWPTIESIEKGGVIKIDPDIGKFNISIPDKEIELGYNIDNDQGE